MYLLISKTGCVSCEAAKKFFIDNNVKFREVNCSDDDLSIEDIEIMKTSPENNNLSVFIKRKFTKDRTQISRTELKDMFDDFAEYGSLPIIIKYNFLNHIENYMIGFSDKILKSWINNDSIVGQYIDLNFAFKSKNCCYMCDKKELIDKINSKENLSIKNNINRLEELKTKNLNFFNKYTTEAEVRRKEEIEEEELVNDEDDLIMANEVPSYERITQKIDFVLKKESSNTIEVPIYEETLHSKINDKNEKKILEKFKDSIRKLSKHKYKKDQEFVIEHIGSSKEEIDIDYNYIKSESSNDQYENDDDFIRPKKDYDEIENNNNYIKLQDNKYIHEEIKNINENNDDKYSDFFNGKEDIIDESINGISKNIDSFKIDENVEEFIEENYMDNVLDKQKYIMNDNDFESLYLKEDDNKYSIEDIIEKQEYVLDDNDSDDEDIVEDIIDNKYSYSSYSQNEEDDDEDDK